MERLSLSFAVMEVDAYDGVRAERRRVLLEPLKGDVLSSAWLVCVDDTDDLGGTIELAPLEEQNAASAREIDGRDLRFVLVRHGGRARCDRGAYLVRDGIRDHRRSLRLLRAPSDEQEAD